MDPFTLVAMATAAGFVFNRMKGGTAPKEEKRQFRYSKDLVARIKPDTKAEFDIENIEVLPEYTLIRTLVQQKFPLIFVTGGAGTGKSTFVRWALKEFSGSVLLGAPTSSAAVNIGGRTLHSLCQLPPGWIRIRDIRSAPKRQEIRAAKLLIIDEISMVTANLLDGVSSFFRKNRGIDKPFGGLTVIMIGDMFQLPPVVSKNLAPLFHKHYSSPKFYNARCLQESTYYAVELNRTYRQSDQQFVDLLTRIREGIDLNHCLALLNQACAITSRPSAGTVWLSPRNEDVRKRNHQALMALRGKLRSYRGVLSGQFPSDRLPSPHQLQLKQGAQVMFTRNDTAKRWTSGSVGIVHRLLDDKLFVELEGDGRIVDVGRATWTNYRYDWDRKKRKIVRIPTGTYQQFPVIPGWAITIHQSQGKTIEKVHVDLGRGSFESGQTYVALSRCRSLAGLSIARPLVEEDILIDLESKHFYDHLREIIERLPPDKMSATLMDP